jgi:hypothetical protein
MLLGFTASAIAQLDTGSISGVVTDPVGKVVQGATVEADETTTGTSYSTTTSATGYYTFPSVHPGTYELKVGAAGFKNEVYTGVAVAVGSSSTRDITLAVGSANEVVSVSAGTVTLEKDTSEIDANIARTGSGSSTSGFREPAFVVYARVFGPRYRGPRHILRRIRIPDDQD